MRQNSSGFVRQVHHTDNWTVVSLEHKCGTCNLNLQAFAALHTADIRMTAVGRCERASGGIVSLRVSFLKDRPLHLSITVLIIPTTKPATCTKYIPIKTRSEEALCAQIGPPREGEG